MKYHLQFLISVSSVFNPWLRIRIGKLRNEPNFDRENSVIESGTEAGNVSSRRPEDFAK